MRSVRWCGQRDAVRQVMRRSSACYEPKAEHLRYLRQCFYTYIIIYTNIRHMYVLFICLISLSLYNICPDMHFPCPVESGHKLMVERPLTLGAAGGSISAIAWRLLAETLRAPATPVPLECPFCDCDCPELPAIDLGRLDLPSIVVGIVLGLLIGPALDLLVLLRASWRWWVRSRLRDLASRGTELYRFA